jgi:hypothetical protein
MRFGLHWGGTLFVGQITTSGRTEVTALGDEVNEGARIEACATGGRALASKELLERLEPEDAATLGLDPDHITYTPLADLPTATDKARRDAPAIAVCEVQGPTSTRVTCAHIPEAVVPMIPSQTTALDEHQASRHPLGRLPLRHGEGGVSGPSASAVENRPMH